MSYTFINSEDILPSPYEPEWEALKSAGSENLFSEASFYLFREAGQLLAIVVATKPALAVVSPDRATLLGLMAKAAKLTKRMIKDASSGDTDQQLSMVREFIEVFANLHWLMDDDGSGERFSMFIESGLNAEKHLMAEIEKNIEQRGGKTISIEERMIRSIRDTLAAAGIKRIDDIRSGKELTRQGFPKIEQRIEDLGEGAYIAYRASSSGIHTTWSDIFKRHLFYDGNVFEPNLQPPRRRPQAHTTMAMLMCQIALVYMQHMLTGDVIKQFGPLFEDLKKRVEKVTYMHEVYLANKPTD